MKKLIALAIVLMLALGACALAEEDVLVEIGGVFSIARPAGLEVLELTEDDAGEGMVYAATNDELEMYVRLCDNEGGSKEALYASYQEDDYLDEVTTGNAGGIEYLLYKSDQELGVVFILGGEQYYEILFFCVTDEAAALAQAAVGSLSLL